MKKVAALLAAVFLAQAALAEVRPEYSGAWFNPDQSGHGFSVEVISPQRTVAFWYAYDPFGKPIFLYAEGINQGDTTRARVYYLEGMIWGEFNPNTNNMMDWGTLSITFHDCRNATLSWDSVLQYDTGEAFGSGEMPLVKLASIEGLRCSDHPLAGVYGGFAYSEADNRSYSGHGLIAEDGRFHFVAETGAILLGQLAVTGGSSGFLTASGTSVFYELGVSITGGNFAASGSYNADMIGAWFTAGPGNDSGTLEIHRLSHITGHTVTMGQLSGGWTAYNYLSGLSNPVTINPNGSFTAIDLFGCIYSGKLTIPNPDLNLLDVTTTVSGCPYTSGTFTGSGAYLENEIIYFSGEDVILLAGANGEGEAAVLRLTRP